MLQLSSRLQLVRPPVLLVRFPLVAAPCNERTNESRGYALSDI
jgi:hypothetical protein